MREIPSLSNQTVMIQIRRNLVDRMLGDVEQGRGNADELVRTMVLEPVELNWDTYERLTRISPMHVGLFRNQSVRINDQLMAPKWQGIGSAWFFIMQTANYLFKKRILKILAHHLVFEERVVITAMYDNTIDQFAKGNR